MEKTGFKPICLANDDHPIKKQSLSNAGDNEFFQEVVTGMENRLSEYVPSYLLFDWIESETTTRRLTVAFLLHSCIMPGVFSARVSKLRFSLETYCSSDRFIHEFEVVTMQVADSNNNDCMEVYHPRL